MKRSIAILLAALLLCAAVPLTAGAATETVTVDGITYLIYDSYASAYRYTGTGGSVVVAEQVAGKRVTEIMQNDFVTGTMTSLTIPRYVSTLQEDRYSSNLFDRGSNLTEIIVATANTFYRSENGVLFSKDMATLLYFPRKHSSKDYTVPGSVKLIKKGAFADSLIETVVLPEGLTRVDHYAFERCTALRSVTWPSTLLSIGYSAFAGTALTELTLPGALKEIEHYTFRACASLRTVTLLSLETLGSNAFSYCPNLSSVTLPDNLRTIEYSAFGGCSSLETIHIPKSVSSIENHAFQRCASLTAFTVSEANKYFCAPEGVLYSKDMTTLHRYPSQKANAAYTVPQGVITIQDYAFEGNAHLSEVSFPESITSTNNWIFDGCNNLTVYGYWYTPIRTVYNMSTFVPLDGTPRVDKVTLTPGSTITLHRGDSLQFSAQAQGFNLRDIDIGFQDSPMRVSWSLTNSEGVQHKSTLSYNGLLTIARDETVQSFTVTAHSSYDRSVSHSVTVIVDHTPYALTVVNGEGSGDFSAGTTVSIAADEAPKGKVFDKWTATAGTIEDANSTTTRFTMPEEEATVTANYINAIFSTRHASTPWNWFLFIVLFGWVWMWFL